MHLFIHEYLKLFRKSGILLLAGLFLLNAGLFWKECREDWVLGILDSYHKEEQQYRDMPLDQAVSSIQARAQELNTIVLMSQFSSGSIDNPQELERMREEYPEAYAEYQQSYQNDPDRLQADNSVYSLLAGQADHLGGYAGYLDGMQQRADDMLSVSIFQKEDFSFRNIGKTLEDFAPLKGIPLKLGLENGVMAFLDFQLTDVFALILILAAALQLFWKERENGSILLVRSCRYGRQTDAACRLAALLVYCIMVCLLLYGSNYFIGQALYGYGDLTRFVQSMPSFSECTLPVTLVSFFLLFFVSKIGVVLLFGMLFGVLFTRMSRISHGMGLLFLLMGGEYAAYLLIPRLSYANPLKYLNLFAFLHSSELFTTYQNLNLAGFPLSRLHAALILGCLLLVCFALFTFLGFISHSQGKKRRFAPLLARAAALLGRFAAHFHRYGLLFFHELRKLFFSDRLAVPLILLVLLAWGNRIPSEPIYGQEDAFYLHYLTQLEGPLTQEKLEIYQEQKAVFDQMESQFSQLEQQRADGTLNEGEYQFYKLQLEESKKKEEAFLRLAPQMEQAQALCAQGKAGGLISELSASYLFGDSLWKWENSILLLAAASLAAAIAFGREYQSEMILLTGSTRRGKSPLFFAKLGSLFLFDLLALAAVYWPIAYNVIRYYPIADWGLSVQTIPSFESLALPCSIGGFVFLLLGLQLLAMLFFTAFSVLGVTWFKNQTAPFLLSSAVGLLCLGGAKLLPWPYLGTNGAFLADALFRENGAAAGLWNAGALLLLLFLLLALALLRFHQKQGRRLRHAVHSTTK